MSQDTGDVRPESLLDGCESDADQEQDGDQGDDAMDTEDKDVEAKLKEGERWFGRWIAKCVRHLPAVTFGGARQLVAQAAKLRAAAVTAEAQHLQAKANGLSGAAAVQGKLKFLRTQNRALTAEARAFSATNKLHSIQNDELIEKLKNADALLEARAYDLSARDGTITSLTQQVEDLTGRLEASRRENADLVHQMSDLKQEAAWSRGKVLAGAMAKPPNFDGKGLLASKGGQQVEDWIDVVHRYTKSLGLREGEVVAVAATYLREDAARAWSAHEAFLQASNREIDLSDLKTCLLQRFTPAATVLQARMQLSALTHGKGSAKTLAHYVTEFDRLCTLIPDLSEGDKVYKFYEGIRKGTQSHLAEKCCMDPTTSTMFTSYSRMRNAALNTSVHSAEFQGAVAQGFEELSKKQSEQSFKRRRHSDGGQQQGGSGRSAVAGGGASSSKAAGGASSSKGGSPAAGGKTGAWGKKLMIKRPEPVFQFCKARGLCTTCYTSGHRASDCLAKEPASGNPPGFQPQ